MKTIRTISILIIVTIGITALVFKSLTIYVPMGFVGVRVRQFSIFGKKGLIKKDFGPGWHMDLGPIDKWALFNSTVQTLEMTREPGRGTRQGNDQIEVTSADGYVISLDVTVKYRIAEGQAYRVFQDTGSRGGYNVIVRTETERECVGSFGTMKTEDFYNPSIRRRTTENVHDNLKNALKDNGVEIIAVLVRDVKFNPEYEQKILDKKLADQEVELNKAEARAAEKRGETEVIAAETKRLVALVKKNKEAAITRMKAKTDLEIAAISAEAAGYATEKRADADLFKDLKEAEGQLLVKKAEAEGERLRNEALSGPGGSIMAALEAAQNLNIQQATVSTLDVDFIDLSAMAKKLGATAK